MNSIWHFTSRFIMYRLSDVRSGAELVLLCLLLQKLFVLDIHFLVEIARNGGYFSDNPAILATLKNSAFLSAGLDPKR